ncbi:NAD(P)/FAD-dependent oxidoreductase [Legionella cardiaca]|uniref:NAD(P)/FAD-dependent oxidoreductase n=1 Tax=Legionella cardiaca TaxID=1071983 RepID=A0ABY8AUI4_9GAMM|nr:NAD(P)/FAD-dependent oxidoreductase [Legionella cardiaca]WED44243.1 NAD(P)/FAD-dependent oxidoreductase [Legionella cardiaca]
MDEQWDCIIIGGGPAGLTAALYLARYRRKILVFDTKDSRALLIPRSHNYPGFPQGISGKNLLKRLYIQVRNYEVPFIHQKVELLQHISKNNFVIITKDKKFYAKTVILCTGIKDIEPQLGNINDGIRRGLIRHCPVCDAFEVINKTVAVVGGDKKALKEAIFLSHYSSDITLLTLNEVKWSRKELKQIRESRIEIITAHIDKISLSLKKAKISFSNNVSLQFDYIYSALGCVKNNKLAYDLNAQQKKGELVVNKKQETSILGVYAAGDIVSGLNQICVATSQAAIAATAIHRRLSINI